MIYGFSFILLIRISIDSWYLSCIFKLTFYQNLYNYIIQLDLIKKKKKMFIGIHIELICVYLIMPLDRLSMIIALAKRV